MQIKNFEFKAKVENLAHYETKLLTLNPVFKGTDQQTDTYFNVPHGRLKLREGNIENSLINYARADYAGAKLSEIILYKHEPNEALKSILSLQFGIKVEVNKKRNIYYIDHIKFHFDEVENLGTFLEVEVIDATGTICIEKLKEQCNFYFNFFELASENLIDKSYSDMLLEKA